MIDPVAPPGNKRPIANVIGWGGAGVAIAVGAGTAVAGAMAVLAWGGLAAGGT